MTHLAKKRWAKNDQGGYSLAMENNVTLWAMPVDYAKGFTPKAARGTKWRAGCSHWDGKSTVSRYGRDVYMQTTATAKEAMALAESVYASAQECDQ
jgi:hypothetical protein